MHKGLQLVAHNTDPWIKRLPFIRRSSSVASRREVISGQRRSVSESRMSHHKYRLFYFDAEGRAECIRLIFHHFKTPFDDIRLSPAEWEKKKPTAPFESLPLLEMENGKKVIADSVAIARYLSKTLGEGFLGRTKLDAARGDMFVYATTDMYLPAMGVKFAKDEGGKKEAMVKFDTAAKKYLKNIEKHLKTNKSGFIVGEYMTWADIFVMYGIHGIEEIDAGLLKKQKPILHYYEKIRSQEGIREYVEEKWPTDLL